MKKEWRPELDELIAWIGEGGGFAIVDDDQSNGIGVILYDGDRETGMALPQTAGDPMPSRGFALLALATMVVKWETMNR